VSRRLGQHFLSDPAILDRIVAAILPTPNDVVLEIGPGEGSLTRRLAPRVARVVAIERDRRLAVALRTPSDDPTGTPLPGNVTIVEGDALTLDWRRVVGTQPAERDTPSQPSPPAAHGPRPTAHGQPPTSFKVIGNIPYYITSPLLERALQAPIPPVVVFLVQREVADRVVARPGGRAYGALSVGVQSVAHAERLFVVRAGAFRPPPKVDSAVLRLTPRPDPVVIEPERAGFRAFVVGLFAQRRKQIARGLRESLGLSRDEAAAACEAADIDPTVRAETLPVETFAALFRRVTR
jgi:16S rRNA (adenine1518-N6/adenine1519-N6)-dimethyltransferase